MARAAVGRRNASERRIDERRCARRAMLADRRRRRVLGRQRRTRRAGRAGANAHGRRRAARRGRRMRGRLNWRLGRSQPGRRRRNPRRDGRRRFRRDWRRGAGRDRLMDRRRPPGRRRRKSCARRVRLALLDLRLSDRPAARFGERRGGLPGQQRRRHHARHQESCRLSHEPPVDLRFVECESKLADPGILPAKLGDEKPILGRRKGGALRAPAAPSRPAGRP